MNPVTDRTATPNTSTQRKPGCRLARMDRATRNAAPAFPKVLPHKNRPTAFGLPSGQRYRAALKLSGVPTPYASF